MNKNLLDEMSQNEASFSQKNKQSSLDINIYDLNKSNINYQTPKYSYCELQMIRNQLKGDYKYQAKIRAKYFPIFVQNLNHPLIRLNPQILSFIDMQVAMEQNLFKIENVQEYANLLQISLKKSVEETIYPNQIFSKKSLEICCPHCKKINKSVVKNKKGKGNLYCMLSSLQSGCLCPLICTFCNFHEDFAHTATHYCSQCQKQINQITPKFQDLCYICGVPYKPSLQDSDYSIYQNKNNEIEGFIYAQQWPQRHACKRSQDKLYSNCIYPLQIPFAILEKSFQLLIGCLYENDEIEK